MGPVRSPAAGGGGRCPPRETGFPSPPPPAGGRVGWGEGGAGQEPCGGRRDLLPAAEDGFPSAAVLAGDGDGRYLSCHHPAHRLGRLPRRLLAARGKRAGGPERAAVGDLVPLTEGVSGWVLVRRLVASHG